MGIFKRLLKVLVKGLRAGLREEKKKGRYKPGDFDRVLGKDMNQVKKRFRGAFGNHDQDQDND